VSSDAFARTTPVNPPIVKRNTNPRVNTLAALLRSAPPHAVASHEKILIPVGTAITSVAAVKYARV